MFSFKQQGAFVFETLRPFLISFAIGLIIGIERERAHPAGSQAMGVRTFTLLALLGTLAYELHSIVFTIAICTFVFGTILFSYYQTTMKVAEQNKMGITTELAAAVVFCLGYLSPHNFMLAVFVGLGVLIILFNRKSLHAFARENLKPKEIHATIMILIMTLLVLSFLPDKTIDPWELFNPRQFGMIVLFVSLIQFGGYIAIRMFGQNFGMPLLGFFGGIASSTTVFATLPELSKRHPTLTRSIVVAAIFAQIGTLVELVVILGFVAPAIFQNVLWPVAAMVLVGLSSVFLVMKNNHSKDLIELPQNPLDLRRVIRLSLFIGSMIITAALARRFFSSKGVGVVTFLGGLFELHSVSIANATLFSSQKIILQNATLNQFLAILSSFLTKFGLLAVLARNRFALISAGFLIAMLIAGFAMADLLGLIHPYVTPLKV
jgi:uncharacterized membrane protein (DUF4010 family)